MIGTDSKGNGRSSWVFHIAERVTALIVCVILYCCGVKVHVHASHSIEGGPSTPHTRVAVGVGIAGI
jgi:hypothetical protein